MHLKTSDRDRRAREFPAHLDQSRLITRAQSGDMQAFNALLEPHLQRIYLAAKKITRNHEDAEDACQESLVKAFVHIRRFEQRAKFSTWLTRIAINEALMTVRRMKVESRYISNDSEPLETPFRLRGQSDFVDPETLCAQAEQKQLLWDAIKQLGTESRLAVCLLGLEEKLTTEAAQAFRLSRSGMRSRLQRAVRKLRAVIAEKLGGSLALGVPVEDKSQY